ncbi:amine oxidase [Mucilaginibacter sp. SMC90]|uniref:amine oxidase n=1 Tax=Mucilaginibacter sp. SMC90 TaxID=2929803 RepID=UPI001FB2226F|nr:amine oxidase [Mucilaginibacter sp. SMC90]UOE52445.1 amine oxidase [Mucilaginibacter sp. SMC90]
MEVNINDTIARSDGNPFWSFWMGGFECSDQLNSFGDRVDLLRTTKHLERIDEDYFNLARFGIRTVREGIRWSKVEKNPFSYDFSEVAVMLDAGKHCGIQQIWDICHFGFPNDLSPLHPHFTRRFSALCVAFVVFYREREPLETLIITPINEVSFISWLGGEAGGTSPFCNGQGWQVKYALMRAYIQGIKQMKAIDPNILIMTTEPLVNMVPPLDATDLEKQQAAAANLEQFQSLDILAGKVCPELGGSPELLDLLGFNYYYNNQWVLGFGEFLPWVNDQDDDRWKPLSELLIMAYARYRKPVLVSETSHPGEDRPLWIEFIGRQCREVIDLGIPLLGVCLYPIIDRPDWDDLQNWHHSGLWDEEFLLNGESVRQLNKPYATALLDAQRHLQFSIIEKHGPQNKTRSRDIIQSI